MLAINQTGILLIYCASLILKITISQNFTHCHMYSSRRIQSQNATISLKKKLRQFNCNIVEKVTVLIFPIAMFILVKRIIEKKNIGRDFVLPISWWLDRGRSVRKGWGLCWLCLMIGEVCHTSQERNLVDSMEDWAYFGTELHSFMHCSADCKLSYWHFFFLLLYFIEYIVFILWWPLYIFVELLECPLRKVYYRKDNNRRLTSSNQISAVSSLLLIQSVVSYSVSWHSIGMKCNYHSSTKDSA